MSTPALDAARSFAVSNLKELAADVLNWQSGKLIPEGASLHQLAELCLSCGFNHDQYQQAERLVIAAALKQIAIS